MGCPCSTEKVVAAESPTKKGNFIIQSPSSLNTSKRPLCEDPFHKADKCGSTGAAMGDSLFSVTITARHRQELASNEEDKIVTQHSIERKESLKHSTFKPTVDSASSIDFKEFKEGAKLQPSSWQVKSLAPNGQKAETTFSNVSKPSIFGLSSMTSEKNTIQKLNDALQSPIPKNMDEGSRSNISIFSIIDGMGGLTPNNGKARDAVMTPSCGNLLSPRPFLLNVPEENGASDSERDRELRIRENNFFLDMQESQAHNKLLEAVKTGEKEKYNRKDSMELKTKNMETNKQKRPCRPNVPIVAKGYRIEVTDFNEEQRQREEFLVESQQQQQDSKSPPKKLTDSPRGKFHFNVNKRGYQGMLTIPFNSTGSFPGSEGIMEESNESYSGGSRDEDQIHSTSKDKSQTSSQIRARTVSPSTKEEILNKQIKTKFRVNLLSIVFPKVPVAIPEKDEASSSRKSDPHDPMNSSLVSLHTKYGSPKNSQEKNTGEINLLRVDSYQDNTNQAKKGKVIPKPLDFNSLEFFNGSEMVSPIYTMLKNSGQSTPVDSHLNSTFLKPLTINSMEERNLFNGEDMDEEGKDMDHSPSIMHPHLPLKKSRFSSKILSKSKSANFDEETGALTKQQINHKHEGLSKNTNNALLSPYYDSKNSYDTVNSLMDVPSPMHASLETKRKRFVNNRPQSQVILTNHLDKSVLEDGYKKLNQYIVLKDLGRGSFGKVKMVINSETHIPFAVKAINKSKLQKKVFAKDKSAFTQIQTEIAVMKKMNHPNVVKLFEVIDDKDKDKLYLIMELVERGAVLSDGYFAQEKDLDMSTGLAEIKSIDEETARKYFRDLVKGIDYMHNYANVIHRDIKPENLLISKDGTLKISDFNIAHMIEDSNDTIKTKGGTRVYMAPETWISNSFRGKPLDIWAAGATLYQFLYGAPPFFTTNPTELKRKIVEDEPEFPEPLGVSKGAIDLIKACLNKNPDKRVTIEQIMKDPWLTRQGREPLTNNQYEIVVTNEEEIRQALTTKLRATFMVATGLIRSLNSARKTLSSVHLDSLTMDKNDE